MAHFSSYKKLEIYVLVRDISKDVWDLIISTSLGKDYKLRDQISASSGSVMDNIAEGFGRGGNKEFVNFLSYARGSCCETESQLLKALDRKHIDQIQYDRLILKTQSEIDQISKFINYLKTSERRGSKFD